MLFGACYLYLSTLPQNRDGFVNIFIPINMTGLLSFSTSLSKLLLGLRKKKITLTISIKGEISFKCLSKKV